MKNLHRSSIVVAAVLLTITLVGVGLLVDRNRNSATVSRSTVQPAAEIAPPELPQYEKLAVIGDSYAVPVTLADHWPKQLAYSHRWSLRNVAKGGTGYVMSKDSTGKYSFLRQLDEIIPVQPDVLIVAGGRNDVSHPLKLGAAVREMYSRFATELPKTRVVIVGPIVGSEITTEAAWKINSEIRAAAAEFKLPFIDAMNEQWLSDPALVKEDPALPNSAGQKTLYEKIDKTLAALGI